MNKIEKYLNKISLKEKIKIDHVIDKIISGKFDGLDIQKLSGLKDLYRIRVGQHRIKFKNIDGQIKIIEIGKKDDKTYKNL